MVESREEGELGRTLGGRQGDERREEAEVAEELLRGGWVGDDGHDAAPAASFFRRTIVSSGGYVGGSIFGVLLLLTYRFNVRRIILGIACAWLALMGLLFARDAFTLGFCLVIAFVPALVWAVLWTAVSVAIVDLGGWLALREQVRPRGAAPALQSR